MRALGPGSVSSLLKVVLDVVYVALMILLAASLLGAAALPILQPFTNAARFYVDIAGLAQGTAPLAGKTSLICGLLVLIGSYFGALIVIINRLRRVFETLIEGDPFRSQNVARLRLIGLALIALEGLGYLVHLAADLVLTRHNHHDVSINMTAWFAILVVFVLAEVFREGARLRDEAELTI
jgi:hypothetical protein